jgi:hypothetical protein
MNKTMASMVNASLHNDILESQSSGELAGLPSSPHVPFWTFTEEHLDIWTRFHERTVLTIGNSQSAPTYQNCIYHLTFNVSSLCRYHYRGGTSLVASVPWLTK